MPNYRRASIPGGCFFFTVNLLERRQTLLVDQIALLREAVVTTRRSHPFTIDAFVVLPDHVHAIWTLPPDDRDFSMRWRLIKSRFARALPKRERRSDVRIASRAANAASLNDPFHRRLQTGRCLPACSDCYRLERPLPEGTCTLSRTVPFHGTRL
jgi:REP element-mobilizing transposase RayT